MADLEVLIRQLQGAVFGNTGDVKAVAYAVTAGAEPQGWLLCDGRQVSRTTYADLFKKLGTVYGAGDGSTTFNLPQTKRRTIVGADPGGAALNAVTPNLGAQAGEEQHTLSAAEMPVHSHPPAAGFAGFWETQVGSGPVVQSGANFEANGSVGSTGNAGGNSPHNTMPPFLTLHYLVKT